MNELRSYAVIAMALAAFSCAEGYTASTPNSGKAGPPPRKAGSADFAGEACERGQRTTCACPDGSEGMKICTPDPKSPTEASFSPCLNCPDPNAAPEPVPGAAGATPEPVEGAAGMSAMSGRSGGASGRAAASSGTGGRGGAGGRMSTTGSGRGSTSGGSGRCNCTQDCFPVGVLACCRLDNSCGCTWAPGAYCL